MTTIDREGMEMFKIERLSTENLTEGCVTDERYPSFSFALSCDRDGAGLKSALFTVGAGPCP